MPASMAPTARTRREDAPPRLTIRSATIPAPAEPSTPPMITTVPRTPPISATPDRKAPPRKEGFESS